MTAETTPNGKRSSFRKQVITSTKLSGLKFISDVGLRLVSTVVLTRLLAPEIYGVFAIVLLYLYLLEMLSDLGIRTLILTKEGDVEDSFLHTCWTVSIIRGLLIFLVSLTISGTIWGLQASQLFASDNPYSDQTLPLAIAAIGASGIIMGFQSPLVFMRERKP